MSNPFTVTFNNPDYNYSGGGSGCTATVGVTEAKPRFEFGSVSDMDLTIDYDVISKYDLETDDSNNPVMMNSTVVLARDGAVWFRGKVNDKPTIQAVQGRDNVRRSMRVRCIGNEGALLNALCPDADGNETWSVSTSTVEVGASSPYLPLEVSNDFGSFESPTLWPDPADATGAKCYIQDADCASDTIAATINAGDTCPFYVEFTITDQGMSPQGWMKINSEWMYREGYDATGSGGKYRTKVKARAQLGTTAATHTAGATAYDKVAKRIGPEPATVYKDGVPLVNGDDYSVQSHYGCFVLVAPEDAATFAATYHVYDEDQQLDGGSTIIYIEDVVRLMVTAPTADGGAGFASGDCDFDATGIAITRFDYDPKEKEVYAWNAITELIRGLNLQDEVKFWFNHTTGKLRLGIIGNAGSPDVTFKHARRSEAERSIKDCHSLVRIAYTSDQDPNSIQKIYSYITPPAAAGAAPDTWYYTSEGGANWEKPSAHTTTYDTGDPADDDFGVEALTDGRLDSKLLAEIFHDPGASFVFGHFWFGSGTTPPMLRLDEIELWINAYRSTDDRTRHNEDNSYICKLQGCADYNTSAHTGTWYDLGKRIKGWATGPAGREAKSVKLELKQFIVREVNAIRVVWDYMAGPIDDGHKYWAVIHRLVVKGNITKYVIIQTTDTAGNKTNPLYVFDEDAHRKLRGGVGASGSAGCPRCKQPPNIGAASEAAAITIGRAHLINGLSLYRAVDYEHMFTDEDTTKPELGDTVATDEDGSGGADYTGVMRRFSPVIRQGAVFASYKVLDYNAARIA